MTESSSIFSFSRRLPCVSPKCVCPVIRRLLNDTPSICSNAFVICKEPGRVGVFLLRSRFPECFWRVIIVDRRMNVVAATHFEVAALFPRIFVSRAIRGAGIVISNMESRWDRSWVTGILLGFVFVNFVGLAQFFLNLNNSCYFLLRRFSFSSLFCLLTCSRQMLLFTIVFVVICLFIFNAFIVVYIGQLLCVQMVLCQVRKLASFSSLLLFIF